jgi:hypothetical protein
VQLRQSLQVFLLVPISIVKDQPLLLQQVVDKLGALVHLGRTLEVACFADRIVGFVGMNCSTRRDSDSWGRILLVAVCSEATTHH